MFWQRKEGPKGRDGEEDERRYWRCEWLQEGWEEKEVSRERKESGEVRRASRVEEKRTKRTTHVELLVVPEFLLERTVGS